MKKKCNMIIFQRLFEGFDFLYMLEKTSVPKSVISTANASIGMYPMHLTH